MRALSLILLVCAVFCLPDQKQPILSDQKSSGFIVVPSEDTTANVEWMVSPSSKIFRTNFGKKLGDIIKGSWIVTADGAYWLDSDKGTCTFTTAITFDKFFKTIHEGQRYIGALQYQNWENVVLDTYMGRIPWPDDMEYHSAFFYDTTGPNTGLLRGYLLISMAGTDEIMWFTSTSKDPLTETDKALPQECKDAKSKAAPQGMSSTPWRDIINKNRTPQSIKSVQSKIASAFSTLHGSGKAGVQEIDPKKVFPDDEQYKHADQWTVKGWAQEYTTFKANPNPRFYTRWVRDVPKNRESYATTAGVADDNFGNKFFIYPRGMYYQTAKDTNKCFFSSSYKFDAERYVEIQHGYLGKVKLYDGKDTKLYLGMEYNATDPHHSEVLQDVLDQLDQVVNNNQQITEVDAWFMFADSDKRYPVSEIHTQNIENGGVTEFYATDFKPSIETPADLDLSPACKTLNDAGCDKKTAASCNLMEMARVGFLDKCTYVEVVRQCLGDNLCWDKHDKLCASDTGKECGAAVRC